MCVLGRRGARLLAAVAWMAACGGEVRIDTSGPTAEWPSYGGDPGGSQYSRLTQITRDNVRHLEVAWTFHTGDIADGERVPGRSAFEATPVLLEDTLYLCSPFNRVFALNPETGEQQWVFDPEIEREGVWIQNCRGVATWVDAERPRGATCRARVFTGTIDARLIALDAETGKPCRDFGDAGAVNLRVGLGEILPGEYGVSSPPTVIGDVVSVGALVGDGRRHPGPSGVVRGFDARTGALRWAFEPVPPGTEPLPPLPDGSPRFHQGTPNAWSILSADPERDLLFVPFGGPSPDFFGGYRNGFDYYGSSVVALRGSTGEVVWHFQTVHHDLWDYDVGTQPTAIEIHRDGQIIPAVAQGTKQGHLFLLHRETGEPLFPVEERPVPQEPVLEEYVSPTQPFPTFPPPLHPHTLTPDDAWGFTFWDRAVCRRKLAAHRTDGIFTPPSLQGTVQYPGVAGGMNWGGVAWDPRRKLLVTPINRTALVITAVPRGTDPTGDRDDGYLGAHPQLGTPYAAAQSLLLSPLGAPCTPPPWGSLVAIDLEAQRIAWEVPLGNTRNRAPWPIWFDWGVPHMGGPLLTAGGLVFIAATMDDMFRAFDIETGEVLWKYHLPAGGQATPMTYRLREDARQYVVLASGGSGSFGTRLGDSLIAFALPRR